MTTDALIERLANDVPAVRRLPRPALRTAIWLGGAVIYLGIIAVALTSRADVAANGSGLGFVVPQLMAIVTGIVAAAAAFTTVIPGYSKRPPAWPVIAASGWMASLAFAARGQWAQPADPTLPSEWVCVALIVASSAPLIVVLVRMLRRGAPLNPSISAGCAALAVAALANIAACVSHPHTNNAVTLLWHGATILTLVVVFAGLGPLVLRWKQRKP